MDSSSILFIILRIVLQFYKICQKNYSRILSLCSFDSACKVFIDQKSLFLIFLFQMRFMMLIIYNNMCLRIYNIPDVPSYLTNMEFLILPTLNYKSLFCWALCHFIIFRKAVVIFIHST